ncbi:PR domain zinc finger protein 5-like [Neocloeon triangulifer]|uniref:PR domain zinc finger protein 5-like n=1 Tax=Neocloeon triangulifer TaxID=2078957 RepID=UPI00286EBBFD|nr:PR domain zinc finger protein 5-like [Neocloeon triangulifer]
MAFDNKVNVASAALLWAEADHGTPKWAEDEETQSASQENTGFDDPEGLDQVGRGFNTSSPLVPRHVRQYFPRKKRSAFLDLSNVDSSDDIAEIKSFTADTFIPNKSLGFDNSARKTASKNNRSTLSVDSGFVDVDLSTVPTFKQRLRVSTRAQYIQPQPAPAKPLFVLQEPAAVKCEYNCPQTFRSASAASRHMNNVHIEFRQRICGICDKSCKTAYGFRIHRKSHNAANASTCELCGKSYFLKSLLKHHMIMRHGDDRPFVCHLCPKAFKLAVSRRIHTTHVHGPGYTCDICLSHFKSRGRFTLHVKNKHLKKKTFDCPICGAKFDYKYNRNAHMENNHNYECSLCDSHFLSADDAKKHCEEEHSKEGLAEVSFPFHRITKFQCDVCYRCLATKQALDRHKDTHRGSEPALLCEVDLITE